MNANQLKKLLKFHRSFGMVLGILVLMWSLTGVLHPIMSATQPQPAKRMPPPPNSLIWEMDCPYLKY